MSNSDSDAGSTESGEAVTHGPRRIDYERWLAYLAGYLDGEGCFRWHSGPQIEIENTFPHTLIEVRKTFGGGVRKVRRTQASNHRTAWKWYVRGDNAVDTLEMVMPFLIEKKRQAELLLMIGDYPNGSSQREMMLHELKSLKRIDYGGLRFDAG